MTTTNESSKRDDGGPAFSAMTGARQTGRYEFEIDGCPGMTLRQYAAIALRQPNSGIDWLDDMIRASMRDELAAKAMGAFCQGAEGFGEASEEKVREAFDAVARFAYMAPDSMLKARG